MKKFNIQTIILILGITTIFTACFDPVTPNTPTVQGLNFVDEVNLGEEIHKAFMESEDYQILTAAEHPELYNYMSGLRAFILSFGGINHLEDFPWEFHIIYDDTKRDVFATVGGHIYIYTEMLKYLQDENQLLNLMAHEATYVDMRINKSKLEAAYDFNLIKDVSKGGVTATALEMGEYLHNQSYTPVEVQKADKATVQAICPTPYDVAGMSYFLQHMGNEPTGWHLRHPSSDFGQRQLYFTNQKSTLGCSGDFIRQATYSEFKTKLP